ncbi:MAG: outer membrane beta-barrel protein [Saprospiraceae bacterium]
MNKILIIIITLFTINSNIYSQYAGSRSLMNYTYFKTKPYYFGIALGYDNANLFLKKSSYFVDDSKYLIVEPSSGVGFHVDMIVNLKLGETFDLRLLPGFSFADKKIDYYTDLSGEVNNYKKFESVFIEVPILVRYKSEPYNDMRAYVLTGIRYSYDVNSNANARNNEDLLKISPHDFQFEIGTGLQFFFPYFIFSPEIKLSTGIGNVLQYDKELKESKVLEKILTKALAISFHFEG